MTLILRPYAGTATYAALSARYATYTSFSAAFATYDVVKAVLDINGQPGAGRGILEVIDPTHTLVEFRILDGRTLSQETLGIPDVLHYGIPVKYGELWEFSFWMMHKAADPDAGCRGTWFQFSRTGAFMGMVATADLNPPLGYILDTPPGPDPWVRYVFQHVIGTESDGYIDDAGGQTVGYVIPFIGWKSTTISPLNARYVMGAMMTSVKAVGKDFKPIDPDVLWTLGDASKRLAVPGLFIGSADDLQEANQ